MLSNSFKYQIANLTIIAKMEDKEDQNVQTCVVCKGKGIYYEEECIMCKGTGKMKVE